MLDYRMVHFGNKSISDLELLAHTEAINMYNRNINNEY